MLNNDHGTRILASIYREGVTDMSTRAIWTGTLTFGLISVPVKLYSATRSKTVRFNQLHAVDNVRIQTKRFCPAEDKEVPSEEIVRGYELSPDRYVVIDDAELEALAPEATRTIEIEDFVALGEIDPIFYDQPYYLAPNTGGAKPYRLLLEVMRHTKKVAIARVVLRSRQRLVAVRPYGNALVAATMMYSDEVNPTDELPDLEEAVDVQEREMSIATQLVESLVSTFDISRYRDTYRDAVLELIERKANGEEIGVQPSRETAPTAAPDLMSALEASLHEVRKRGESPTAAANGASRRRRTASKSKAKSESGSGSGKARRGDHN